MQTVVLWTERARSCSYRGIELEVSTLGLPHRTIDTRNRVRSTARPLVVRPTERSVLCMSRSQEPGCLLCIESRYTQNAKNVQTESSGHEIYAEIENETKPRDPRKIPPTDGAGHGQTRGTPAGGLMGQEGRSPAAGLHQ